MTIPQFLALFYWDPPVEAFTIPYFEHPIVWYGILFVSGFVISYFLMIVILARFISRNPSSQIHFENLFDKGQATPKRIASLLADRLSWFTIIGTVIGARLGAVFFYDWDYFRENPIEIFKVWHGGLASHGGTLGVMLSLFFFSKYIKPWIPQLTFLQLLDFAAIPSALTAFFIRLGNFMNQEILGTPSSLPWGVIFGHPADGSFPSPRHPVQLYEAAAYLTIFFILWNIWKNQKTDEKPGKLIGWLLILVFSSRFILEFWKATQDSVLNFSFLQTGQILSLPFILLGIILLMRSRRSFAKGMNP